MEEDLWQWARGALAEKRRCEAEVAASRRAAMQAMRQEREMWARLHRVESEHQDRARARNNIQEQRAKARAERARPLPDLLPWRHFDLGYEQAMLALDTLPRPVSAAASASSHAVQPDVVPVAESHTAPVNPAEHAQVFSIGTT